MVDTQLARIEPPAALPAVVGLIDLIGAFLACLKPTTLRA